MNAADLPGFEPAGPRRSIFFDPAKVRAGIVTCGGLCPGINDVIRGIVMELAFHYGVQRIYGFRNGYQGFIPCYGHDVVDLTPEVVSRIAEDGGTIRGAMQIARVAAERGCRIAVVGIPKTIDNDIPYIDQSFGFQTAFAEATNSIRSAHVEAKASPNGVGLVKLMGRHSGFIACYASLAEPDANYVLIPEVPLLLDGPGGFLAHLATRVRDRGHAVIVVAEGGPLALDPRGHRPASRVHLRRGESVVSLAQEPTLRGQAYPLPPSRNGRVVTAGPARGGGRTTSQPRRRPA